MEPDSERNNLVMEPRKLIRNVDNSCVREINNIDRISGLPDSVLGVILSSIPTKNAVATSVLSKRWEFVWRMVHNLDFRLETWGRGVEGENKKFVEYVNHVLFHHDAGMLNKFHLLWRPDCIQSDVASWIKTAVTRNVRELSLNLGIRFEPFDIPITVFSCSSLRCLHLDGSDICLSAPNVFCLPRLETLFLFQVYFQSDKDLEKIIKGCPVLNYLDIYMEENARDSRFVISSTSLKHLALDLGTSKYVKLDASSLEHLVLRNYISVAINVSTDFKRLVELRIECYCCEWRALLNLIQSSNSLEILAIEKCLYENDHDHSKWISPVEVPRCLSTSLKKVVIDYYYYGFEDEPEIIRYMLNHGSVLEVMQISFNRELRGLFEQVEEICEYPRKSATCEIKFIGWTSKGKKKVCCTVPPGTFPNISFVAM